MFPLHRGQCGVHALSCPNRFFQFLDHGHQRLADDKKVIIEPRNAEGVHRFGDLLVMLLAHGRIELADPLLSLNSAALGLTFRFR